MTSPRASIKPQMALLIMPLGRYASEFTLWQQRMRGALSQLPMALGPWIWRPTVGSEGPAQMNLFEGLLP